MAKYGSSVWLVGKLLLSSPKRCNIYESASTCPTDTLKCNSSSRRWDSPSQICITAGVKSFNQNISHADVLHFCLSYSSRIQYVTALGFRFSLILKQRKSVRGKKTVVPPEKEGNEEKLKRANEKKKPKTFIQRLGEKFAGLQGVQNIWWHSQWYCSLISFAFCTS